MSWRRPESRDAVKEATYNPREFRASRGDRSNNGRFSSVAWAVAIAVVFSYLALRRCGLLPPLF